MKSSLAALIASAFLVFGVNPLAAQPASTAIPASSQPSAEQGSMTEGEVRKIDAASQKMTLRHGDIKNLGMPGMTMVFKVPDPKLLSGIKEGDKVRFTADRVDGVLTVTSIETVGPVISGFEASHRRPSTPACRTGSPLHFVSLCSAMPPTA